MPPDYYRRNVCSLVSGVLRTYHDLLGAEELAWAQSLLDASHQAQCLYIRLLLRKGSSFRLATVQYPEVRDPSAAARELVAVGLARAEPPADFSEVLARYTATELRCLLACLPVNRPLASRTRGALEAAMLEADVSVHQRLRCHEPWLQLVGELHYQRYCLCFFGNLHQDISEFVRRDIGSLRYEPYRLDKNSRAFASRAQLDAHWRFFECEAEAEPLGAHDRAALLALDSRLPSPDRRDAHLNRRVERLRTALARQLERLGELDHALNLYVRCQRPPARERRIRVLMALDRWPEAERLCQRLLATPFNDEERQVGHVLARHIARASDQPIEQRRPARPPTTTLTLRPSEERVEQQACRYYARTGTCHHVESALLNSVLGLFIWDIIFAPVPGVFFNPFQAAPADYGEPEFLLRRACLLQVRLLELDDEAKFRHRVLQCHTQKQGIANPLVHWQRVPRHLLELSLARIPVLHWRLLFKRLLQDLRGNGSGLPDLVYFDRAGGYEFIEIKGPGDVLQRNQRRWLGYFVAQGMPARVVRIRWAGHIERPEGA